MSSPQYLVEMAFAPFANLPSPAELTAFAEKMALPTLEACRALAEAGRIVAGGPALGAIGFHFIARADSPQELEEMLARRPKAIILSGGPASVYAPGAPPAPPGLLQAGVPLLGICYGFQLMVAGLGGEVRRTAAGEYGATDLEVTGGGTLLPGPPQRQRAWMSHGDTAVTAPPGFAIAARTAGTGPIPMIRGATPALE